MDSSVSVGVIVSLTNDGRTPHHLLRGIRDQTLPPETIILVVGTTGTDSIKKLEYWRSELPLRILTNPDQSRVHRFNRALKMLQTKYIVRAEAHTYWAPSYLEMLIESLANQPDAAAATGTLCPGTSLTNFQRDAWSVMNHPLGTGAPGLNIGDQSSSEQFRSPVYRYEVLRSNGGFPEQFPWAETEALHESLRANNWTFIRNPEIKSYYFPPGNISSMTRHFFHYGQGRGRLGARNLFPTDRHQHLDRALILWTLGLSWNPVGWGLFMFYLLVIGLLTVEERARRGTSVRFFYLLPLVQLSYWIGWLTTRWSHP